MTLTTNEKLTKLRALMKEAGVDAVFVPSNDSHGSEYVAPRFRSRAYITGFTGSAGKALITADEALVWADGRYFIQCEKEIAGSEFKMMKWGLPGVPEYSEWLAENMPEGATIAFDGSIMGQAEFESLKCITADLAPKFKEDRDFIGEVWEDRPAMPHSKAFVLAEKYSGASVAEQAEKVRKRMKHVDFFIATALDDVAWLYNLRGFDIDCCPVNFAYAIVAKDPSAEGVKEILGEKGLALFIYADKLDDKGIGEVTPMEYLKREGVKLYDYEEILEVTAKLPAGASVMIDPASTSRNVYKAIPAECKIKKGISPITCEKAIKNPTEIANTQEAYLREGVALVKFQMKLEELMKKAAAGEGEFPTEMDLSDLVLRFREEQEGFIEVSFTSISAYGENAAMMHYNPAGAEVSPKVLNKGLYLLDSGGQYVYGTTDITRTFAVGELTPEMKRDYTYTLKSAIMLMDAKFLYGVSGSKLDGIARYHLWQIGSDYKCGTGHGVGYVLNVHEGPQRFGFAPNTYVMEPGMLITVEPGVYREGQYGIRIENDLFVEEDCETESGKFLRLRNVCCVPIDKKPLEPALMTEAEKDWLNRHHADCYEKLAPRLDTDEEREWLKEACAPI